MKIDKFISAYYEHVNRINCTTCEISTFTLVTNFPVSRLTFKHVWKTSIYFSFTQILSYIIFHLFSKQYLLTTSKISFYNFNYEFKIRWLLIPLSLTLVSGLFWPVEAFASHSLIFPGRDTNITFSLDPHFLRMDSYTYTLFCSKIFKIITIRY